MNQVNVRILSVSVLDTAASACHGMIVRLKKVCGDEIEGRDKPNGDGNDGHDGRTLLVR